MSGRPLGTKQMIDPERLTPASARALRKILAGFSVFVLCLALSAFTFSRHLDHVASCRARAFSWDSTVSVSKALTKPAPTAGFSGQVLTSRKLANVQRAEALQTILATLGARPEC